jgi:hypothetical protein
MLTDQNNARENKTRQNVDHEVGIKVLFDKESLRKAESTYEIRTMDYYPGLYKWNNQGSTQSKIGKIKIPESKTIPR